MFEMDMKKEDHSLTPSLANINTTPDYRLFVILAF